MTATATLAFLQEFQNSKDEDQKQATNGSLWSGLGAVAGASYSSLTMPGIARSKKPGNMGMPVMRSVKFTTKPDAATEKAYADAQKAFHLSTVLLEQQQYIADGKLTYLTYKSNQGLVNAGKNRFRILKTAVQNFTDALHLKMPKDTPAGQPKYNEAADKLTECLAGAVAMLEEEVKELRGKNTGGIIASTLANNLGMEYLNVLRLIETTKSVKSAPMAGMATVSMKARIDGNGPLTTALGQLKQYNTKVKGNKPATAAGANAGATNAGANTNAASLFSPDTKGPTPDSGDSSTPKAQDDEEEDDLIVNFQNAAPGLGAKNEPIDVSGTPST